MTDYRARFFHDWSAGWLWASNDEAREAFDNNIDHHVIGLSPELAAELDRLADWHDSSLGKQDQGHPCLWRQPECDAFNRDVSSAFSRLVVELGSSWHLVNESREMQEDPDLDSYLQDPGGFRR